MSGLSFEELTIEAQHTMRPDDDFLNADQYTQAETVRINEAANTEKPISTPEPTDETYLRLKERVRGLVKRFVESKGDLTRLTNLARNLRWSNVTNELHPHILREVRIAIKAYSESWWTDMQKALVKRISEQDSDSFALLGYLVDDLTFLKDLGVDVKAYAVKDDEAVTEHFRRDQLQNKRYGERNLDGASYLLEKLRAMK